MQCANCQTDIEENTLIRFRCGEATAHRRREPVSVKRPLIWRWIVFFRGELARIWLSHRR